MEPNVDHFVWVFATSQMGKLEENVFPVESRDVTQFDFTLGIPREWESSYPRRRIWGFQFFSILRLETDYKGRKEILKSDPMELSSLYLLNATPLSPAQLFTQAKDVYGQTPPDQAGSFVKYADGRILSPPKDTVIIQTGGAKNVGSKIEELELSCRVYNCLKKTFIHTVRELVKYKEKELLLIRGLGRKGVDEIKLRLLEWGLYLGQELPQTQINEDEEVT